MMMTHEFDKREGIEIPWKIFYREPGRINAFLFDFKEYLMRIQSLIFNRHKTIFMNLSP